MLNRQKLVHIHSTVKGKAPSPESINYGEIAINYNSEGEQVFIRNNQDQIVNFIPEKAIDSKIDSVNNSLSAKIDGVNDALSEEISENAEISAFKFNELDNLSKEVSENAEVVATSLNNLDTKISCVEGSLSSNVEAVSKEVKENAKVSAFKFNEIDESQEEIKNLIYNYPQNDNGYDGHVDWKGLKTIGWSDDDISYLKTKGVNWNKKDDGLNVVPQADKDLMPMDKSKIAGAERTMKYCPYFDTSQETDMKRMFDGCSSLTTVPKFDTGQVTDMHQMFKGCSGLTSIPLLDTSSVTDMVAMLKDCTSIISIPRLDTSKVTNMGFMFYKCSSLTSVPQFDISKVTIMDGMFYGCTSLKDLGGFTGLKCDLDLSSCTKLTKQSLLNVINEAASGVTGVTMTFGSTNLAKLTNEEKAIATQKGWTLA